MAAKLKSLLPTLRERKRYLVFEILAEHAIEATHVQKAIDNALLSFGGSKMIAKAGIHFFKERYINNTGILRCAHTAVDEVKSALLLITHIDNKEVALCSIRVTGMINKT